MGCLGIVAALFVFGLICEIIVPIIDEIQYKRKKEQEKAEAKQRLAEEIRRREEAEKERQKQARFDHWWKMFNEYKESIEKEVASAESEIRKFLCDVSLGYYDSMNNNLKLIISRVQNIIPRMKETNDSLIEEFPEADRSVVIHEAETNTLPKLVNQVNEFEAFSHRVCALPFSKMMDEKNYGRINKIYWDVVHGMVRADALKYISTCEQHLNAGHVDAVYAIDVEKVMRCVWLFATEKPFSASDFQKAKSVFYKIYKQDHVDIIIADMYVKKTVGGEDALRDPVRDMLKQQVDARTLTLIASSFMWMNAYQIEHMVLQHMLATGKEMTAKTQERLHSLTNGGGKAPSGFDVKSSGGVFYFDVSALAWRDDEYVGLFENLAFQDKNLTYSLAIRDENKELFVPQGITIPSNNLVLEKLNAIFTEEYGNSVTVRSTNCIALSGSGEETMEGILVSSKDCKQMGILIHITGIGKKLIITFYTLFVPNESSLAVQKQQALSIFKKLSPSVNLWESSLKDTMLMAVEQILNSNVQGGGITNTDSVGGGGNEPVF